MPESPSSHAASLLRHLCSNIFAPLRSPSPYLRSNTSFSLKLLCFSGFARRGRPSLGEAALHLKGWTLHSCLPNEMDISGCHRCHKSRPYNMLGKTKICHTLVISTCNMFRLRCFSKNICSQRAYILDPSANCQYGSFQLQCQTKFCAPYNGTKTEKTAVAAAFVTISDIYQSNKDGAGVHRLTALCWSGRQA